MEETPRSPTLRLRPNSLGGISGGARVAPTWWCSGYHVVPGIDLRVNQACAQAVISLSRAELLHPTPSLPPSPLKLEKKMKWKRKLGRDGEVSALGLVQSLLGVGVGESWHLSIA